jgi:hypothetical protein
MKKIVMLLAVLLGTTVMVNANTITKKATTSKEVKATTVSKHKKHRKAKKAVAKTTTAATPAPTTKK